MRVTTVPLAWEPPGGTRATLPLPTTPTERVGWAKVAVSVLFAFTLIAAACGDDDDTTASDDGATDQTDDGGSDDPCEDPIFTDDAKARFRTVCRITGMLAGGHSLEEAPVFMNPLSFKLFEVF